MSLLPNTILVNDDGITFKTDARVTIPPGNPAQPGKIDVDVRAEKIAENGMIVGELGNITQDSVLYVKKLPESMESKLVYATAKRSFA